MAGPPVENLNIFRKLKLFETPLRGFRNLFHTTLNKITKLQTSLNYCHFLFFWASLLSPSTFFTPPSPLSSPPLTSPTPSIRFCFLLLHRTILFFRIIFLMIPWECPRSCSTLVLDNMDML